MVTDGVVRSNAKARLIRDGVAVYDGAINTIQKEKDVIEAYEMVEIKR